MDNLDKTEKDKLIRNLYQNTKLAIISSVKNIVKNASEELVIEKIAQAHSKEKSLTFSKEIVEQVVQEFNFFIASRAEGDYIYNLNDKSEVYSKSGESYQREQKALEELDKLLDTAEKIEGRKNSLFQKINITKVIMVMSCLGLNYVVVQSGSFNIIDDIFTKTPALILVSLPTSLLYYRQISKEYSKEKRALNKIVLIIQEVIPYHLKEMSVLEKANFEVRLARMNISVAGSDS